MIDQAAVLNLIELALFQRLETMPFGIYAPLPFAFPNDDFTPPENGRYIEVKHFPNSPVNYAWRGIVGVANGFLQASVHWERNAGTIEPNSVAGLVAAHFSKGMRIATSEFVIAIYKPPEIAAFVSESSAEQGRSSKLFVPVTIYYRAETI